MNIMRFLTALSISIFVTCCEVKQEEDESAREIQTAFSTEDGSLPTTLADTKLFIDGDPQRPQRSVFKYQSKHALWSDGAKKSRYIFTPPGTSVTRKADSFELDFPVGTILAKHFASPEDLAIETRLMYLNPKGEWLYATYVWNDDGQAELNVRPKTVVDAKGFEWRVPSAQECAMCHGSENNRRRILGFSLRQLDFVNDIQNQIDALNQVGVLSVDRSLDYEPKLADLTNSEVTIEDRARTYLDVNCSSCHQPHGEAEHVGLDLRLEVSLEETGLISEGKIVPGSLSESIVWNIFSKTDGVRMPMLSLRVDPVGLEVLGQWIEQLEGK